MRPFASGTSRGLGVNATCIGGTPASNSFQTEEEPVGRRTLLIAEGLLERVGVRVDSVELLVAAQNVDMVSVVIVETLEVADSQETGRQAGHAQDPVPVAAFSREE